MSNYFTDYTSAPEVELEYHKERERVTVLVGGILINYTRVTTITQSEIRGLTNTAADTAVDALNSATVTATKARASEGGGYTVRLVTRSTAGFST